jgi:hypothetical protein
LVKAACVQSSRVIVDVDVLEVVAVVLDDVVVVGAVVVEVEGVVGVGVVVELVVDRVVVEKEEALAALTVDDDDAICTWLSKGEQGDS